ncbi:MAG TPA: fumarylacetoacetate hydrolase family protein [Acidobacteriota bacterium]|nr:fumarylacetoacetate hydrolase family protein [Acidobacteriota bacterium]
MKLATLRSPNPSDRDGRLAVVSRDNRRAVLVGPAVAPTLLRALQSWDRVEPDLRKLYESLNRESARESFELNPNDCLAPLPNAPGFYDGSAFLSHVRRAREARGDRMPESAKQTPLMYQGVSDNLLAWNAPIDLIDPSYGGDFEGEFGIVPLDVPRGTPSSEVSPFIALIVLFNDITFREIVKTEIQTKFGFLQSKPNSSFAPLAVTPDELGEDWRDGRIGLDLEVRFNDQLFGRPNGREMHFSFFELTAHACRTRPLSAGSVIGSGTVSNQEKERGFACLTEKRFQEVLDGGSATTEWLQPGDRVRMDCRAEGRSVFGTIDQAAVL